MSSFKKEPWRCIICKRLAKGNAQFCPECGRHWQECVDSSFVSGNPEQHHGAHHAGDAYHNQWHGKQSYSQSPRRRQHKASAQQRGSTPRGKGYKGQGRKGGLKGKDASKGMAQQQPGPYLAPPPPPALPEWTVGQGDTAWPIPPASSTPALATPPATLAPSQAEAQLKQVLAVLQQNADSLPPQIQAVVKDTNIKESKHQIKNMHQAVTELGKAQRQLEEALSERSQSLASWRQFLHASVQRWSEYTKRFQDQEQAHLATIAQARDALRAAQIAFKEKQDQGGIITINDEEGAVQPDVAMRDESAHRINEGLQQLTSSLQELAHQADRDHAEEQTKKRPRTGALMEEQPGEKALDGEDGSTKPSFG